MPAPEPLSGHRVVATPAVVDAIVTAANAALTVRFAPDEVLVVGVDESTLEQVATADVAAIVEADDGWVALRLSPDEFANQVEHHLDWRPDLQSLLAAQGLFRGVPVKIVRHRGDIVVVSAVCTAHELAERVG